MGSGEWRQHTSVPFAGDFVAVRASSSPIAAISAAISAAEPSAEHAPELAAEPAAERAAKPAAKPAAANSAAEPTTTELAAEPAAEPAAERAAKPAAKPSAQLTPAPASLVRAGLLLLANRRWRLPVGLLQLGVLVRLWRLYGV